MAFRASSRWTPLRRMVDGPWWATAWRHVSQAMADMQHVTLSEDSLSRILKLRQVLP